MRGSLLAVLLAACSAVLAQGADVGVLNLVAGDITYLPRVGPAAKAQAFMKVRDGDRFNLEADAQLRVVYFRGARQERWTGPATFRAGSVSGQPIAGAPTEVVNLPANVSVRMSRVPEFMRSVRLGGVQVRSTLVRNPDPTPEQQKSLREAHATYEQIRTTTAPDDITPELYLCEVLSEYQRYDDMKPIVSEMRRKQPDDQNVKALEEYVRSRAAK